MIHVVKLKKTCDSCPSQWDGETDQGDAVYARYRWGGLSVTLNDVLVFERQIGEDQDDDAVEAEMRAEGIIPKNWIDSMAQTWRMIREFHPDAILCYDGTLSLEQLREVTKGQIEWPATDAG